MFQTIIECCIYCPHIYIPIIIYGIYKFKYGKNLENNKQNNFIDNKQNNFIENITKYNEKFNDKRYRENYQNMHRITYK